MDVFSKRLRKRARELKLSDAEVARRAGLNERRYGHYTTGAREPNLDTLVLISGVLETTPNDLLGFDGDGSTVHGGESGMGNKERETFRQRLIAASNSLEIDNLRLAVKQIETLLRHQRKQRRGN